MTYSLRRQRDGMGDSGLMSDAYHWPNGEDADPEVIHNSKPFVGATMRVGTPFARSFTAQDWWQTTPVTEIIKEWTDWVEDQSVECVHFKTGNSEYIWEKF